MSGDSRVLTRLEGRVLVLTFNRPEARNALDAATRAELLDHLGRAASDEAVGAVVITGSGSCFAAGADLRELLSRSPAEQRAVMQATTIFSAVEDLPKPVIAALNGHALGAGLELATACDVRVCASGAKLGQPEVNLGLIPGGGGTQRLVRLIGAGRSAQMVLTGDPVTAHQALAWGLVDQVVEDDVGADVAAAGIKLAERMARHDRKTIAAAKAALQAATRLPYDQGLAFEVERFLDMHARPEARSRIQAFLER